MKNNRLFAFGDSFCNYAWPMWPELLGQCYEKVHNHGLSGCGNFYIFYKSLIELSLVDLEGNDTVIIQWSEPLRYDFVEHDNHWSDVTDNYWNGLGIASAAQFIKDRVSYLNNDTTATLKHLTYMLAMAQFLDNKKCKWVFIFSSPDAMSHSVKLDASNNLLREHKDLLNELLKYKDNIVDKSSIFDMTVGIPSGHSVSDGLHFEDDHPTPVSSYQFIYDCMSNHLNLRLDEIKEYSELCEDIINKNKIQIGSKLVNNFEILNKVFNNHGTK